ncbi:5,6-dimethylbenzimidazole synthase [Inquilinus limosus]|uniref:Cob(II)yrinic acid a,c-diamide reductase n=1 Tax=Inquilinus limosus MP06 TaxID=1398085 RepID=A0A0A0CY57_9PROT|nr:5,6-dimethylbenzimidazole synthase [Inquilinus limosus]KGM31376.1 cob(II)yrinic acid a,c-diamide reductase [Inquilinus limosus MP06]
MAAPDFPPEFHDRFADLLRWRRDVRRFRRDPLPPGLLDRLLDLACLAPSVGNSQPWRFVLVEDAVRRAAVRSVFSRCNADAASGYEGERAVHYRRLKLAGLEEAPVQLAVFCDRSTGQGHGLGRQTMPETLDHSAVTAIHTLWLAARIEGVGLGWVSILEPEAVAALLDVPPEWHLVGYLCLGFPESEESVPELEREGWQSRLGACRAVLRR